MFFILQKIHTLIEIFINGTFVLLYALKQADRLPGYWNLNFVNRLISFATWMIPLVLFFVVIINYLNSSSFEDFIRKHVFSLIIFIHLMITWGDVEFTFWLASSHLALTLYDVWNFSGYKKKKVWSLKSNPFGIFNIFRLKSAQWVMFSFIVVVCVGTFLLMLPISSSSGKSISIIDALFMATSATCVTGLTTLSLLNDFSLWGQLVVLLLIQVGGLGIMILYSSMIIFMGKSMDMKSRFLMQDLLNISNIEDLLSMIVDIIKYTLIIELWGAIILTCAFIYEGFGISKAIYYGFFHSISAFCNAGFSLFDNSLESFATNPLVHGTVAILIILGGLGFIVLQELTQAFKHKKGFVRFGLHTKIVLVTSLLLLVLGFLIIFFGEFLNSLDGYTLWEKIQISFFQSVTLRTAGFSTIPLNTLNTHILYLMTLFMYIGASPGSTGGGLKTTTLAILFQSIKSTLKGYDRVELFKRRISQVIVVRATALTILSIFTSSVFIFLLMKFDPEQTFLSIFFEVASASGTVGLTLGITPYLTGAGKFAISLLMLIGRVGPLTMVLAVGQAHISRGRMDYPDGRVMIG